MNKNNTSNPCKDCITLGMCRAKLYELIESANLSKNGVDLLVCMLELSVNCSILSNHLERESTVGHGRIVGKFHRALKVGEYILRGEAGNE
jgi:hypothetical protein